METLKNISSILGCISAIIAFIVLVFKPIRKSIVGYFSFSSEHKKLLDGVSSIQLNVEQLTNDLKSIETRHNELAQNLIDLRNDIQQQEASRLKEELNCYAGRIVHKIPIYPEEFDIIQAIYRRYHNELGKNHEGTLQFERLTDYYYKRGWED